MDECNEPSRSAKTCIIIINVSLYYCTSAPNVLLFCTKFYLLFSHMYINLIRAFYFFDIYSIQNYRMPSKFINFQLYTTVCPLISNFLIFNATMFTIIHLACFNCFSFIFFLNIWIKVRIRIRIKIYSIPFNFTTPFRHIKTCIRRTDRCHSSGTFRKLRFLCELLICWMHASVYVDPHTDGVWAWNICTYVDVKIFLLFCWMFKKFIYSMIRLDWIKLELTIN